MTAKVGDTWWRAVGKWYSVTLDADLEIFGTSAAIEFEEYEVLKVTPCGVRLRERIGAWNSNETVFVLNSATRRRASPTKGLALESLIARRKRQALIYDNRADEARTIVRMAEQMKERMGVQ